MPIDVLTPGEPAGDEEMTTAAAAIRSEQFEQNRARILSAGAGAHEHHINYGKILDYAYEADRKMVSLVESLGVRESTSKSGQKGIPEAAEE